MHFSYSQFSSITGSAITNDNLRINIVFDEEIYSNSSCSSLTCIEVSDFTLSLSGEMQPWFKYTTYNYKIREL